MSLDVMTRSLSVKSASARAVASSSPISGTEGSAGLRRACPAPARRPASDDATAGRCERYSVPCRFYPPLYASQTISGVKRLSLQILSLRNSGLPTVLLLRQNG